MSSTLQHKVVTSEGFLTLRLQGQLVPESVPSFEAEIRNLVSPNHHVVIDCSHLSGLCKQWLRPLIMLETEVSRINKKVRLINVNEKVEKYFVTEGVNTRFKTRNSLREALVDMGLASKKLIDTAFINPFLAAAMRTLELQAKSKATPGKIFLKKPNEAFLGDISGVIGLVSTAFTGSVVISFPQATFLEIVSRMFGEKVTEMKPEYEDAAAELTNIIFGQAKIILNEIGHNINTALPSVISGKDHKVSAAAQGVSVVIPFESDAGKFFIEITTSV